jgi:hypothetical protein
LESCILHKLLELLEAFVFSGSVCHFISQLPARPYWIAANLWKLGFLVHEKTKICKGSWALVAHTCNPSNSGGRDQEDRSLMPGYKTLSRKNPSQKNNWWEWAQGLGPEFKSQYLKKKKKTDS